MKNKITVDDVMKSVRGILGGASIKDECFFKSMMEHGLEMSDDVVIDWKFCEPKTWKEIRDKYMTRGFTGPDVEPMTNKNNNYITTPAQLKPHELFQSITEGMLEVFKRKNADYGNSFDKSLDDDGLLVAKVRLGDKYNRFSQLIKQPQQVSDESLEDTLLDMANYAIMTVMWMRGQDKQLQLDFVNTGISTGAYTLAASDDYIPKEQYDMMVEWAESELCGAVAEGLKVGDMVIYTDSNNITSTGKITEVVALMSETLDTPSLRYVIDGELYSRGELSKCADDTIDNKDTSVEPYKRGDRVRIVDAYDRKHIGKVGVVQSVVSTNPNEYTIMFKPGKWTHDMLEPIKED